MATKMWELKKISYNSAYVTVMAKKLHQTGVSRVVLFNSLIGIKNRPLLPW